MTALLIVLAGAVIWVHLYHQGRHTKQLLRDTDTLLEVMQERDDARDERDSAHDALRDVMDRLGWGDPDAAYATASMALENSSYHGRLGAARRALNDIAARYEALHARVAAGELPDDDVDEDELVFHGHQQYRKEEDR